MKAVILAGGKGARLAPYTKILPKPLMPIGDMPILEILLRQMKRFGVNDVVLTVGYLSGLFCAFFQEGQRLGLNIEYSFEEHPLGTAGPLSLISGLDETFLVSNGDVLTTLDLGDLVDFHKRCGAIATIASHLRSERIDYGVIQVNGDHQIIGYIEKPINQFLVSMGIYVFEPAVLSYIEHNEYLDLPNLVLKMVEAGERVLSFPFSGYWMDLGRVNDYEQAVDDFEKIKDQILGESTHEGTGFAETDSHIKAPQHAEQLTAVMGGHHGA